MPWTVAIPFCAENVDAHALAGGPPPSSEQEARVSPASETRTGCPAASTARAAPMLGKPHIQRQSPVAASNWATLTPHALEARPQPTSNPMLVPAPATKRLPFGSTPRPLPGWSENWVRTAPWLQTWLPSESSLARKSVGNAGEVWRGPPPKSMGAYARPATRTLPAPSAPTVDSSAPDVETSFLQTCCPDGSIFTRNMA